MVRWFKADAPIRQKFVALALLASALASMPLVAAIMWGGTPNGSMVMIAAAVAAQVSICALLLIARKLICDPYVTTVVRMEALAAGEFAEPIRFSEYRDCVGRMSRAMVTFRDNGVRLASASDAQQLVVASLGEGLDRLAGNDLSHRIDTNFPGETDRLRQDYNRAMAAVADALNAVTAVSENIHGGAFDISRASDDLSQRTEQQAASLEETAAAMDEITAMVRQSATGAAQAKTIVALARDEAEQSGAVVNRAIDAMDAIERASNEIGEIISVIDGIAFQTNLLALNAGVEAARAGDAGKGFAVVASEVRALAQRSADAARDVKMRITASGEQVSTGVALVNETGDALTRIVGRIGEVSTLVHGIAETSGQQASGLQQVNAAVSEMDGVTQRNAAMVEQVTAAARALAAHADQLAAQVGRFNLSRDPVHAAGAGNAPIYVDFQRGRVA
ncbi:methyl-accepting chemotaxis protein [uncultured Sphingomonas sp.]|uniref:methyl-accepting chemotaxis protein n=1 Tax=uncultured Sphingomonas sp. TaxID=158754 RepID=UPI0025F3DBE4|nr:methyl-accepting chemotaxis protein [uncultured Sphingomonas sp.]